MANVKVRNLDDQVVDFHRRRAAQAGRSLEAELRRVLTEATYAKRRKMVREITRNFERLRKKVGTLPDSAPGIRAEREGRG
jgi:plasmid stability protein